jgi:hypothetical protein
MYTLWRGAERLGTFEKLVPVDGPPAYDGAWGILHPTVPAGTLVSMIQATMRPPMPEMTTQHFIEPLTEEWFRNVSTSGSVTSEGCNDENTPPAQHVPEARQLIVTDQTGRRLEVDFLQLQEQIFPEGFTDRLPFEQNATSRWTVHFFGPRAT